MSWLALILLLLMGITAHAQEFEESADQPSAFVTVIEAKEYDDRFETVEDVLTHTAGVRVRRFGALGAYSTASIRGSKPEQVLVLMDGVRLNSSQRGAVDLSTLSLRTIERIEVIRGGGAARYGSDAIGGVISITSRQPTDENEADFSALTGSMRTLGGDGVVSGSVGELRGSLAYSRLRSDNDFKFDLLPSEAGSCNRGVCPEPSRHRRLNADFVEDTGSLNAFWDLNATTELSSQLHLYRKDNGQPGNVLGVPAIAALDAQASCTRSEEDYRRGILQFGYLDRAVGPGSLKGSVYHRYERSEFHVETLGCNQFPVRVRSQAIDTQSGLELAFAGRPTSLGPARLLNRSSLSLRLDRVRSDDVDAKRRYVGTLFSQQEIQLFSGRLRLFPALGLDMADTSSGQARSAKFLGFEDVNVNDDTEWLPRIGGILRLAPGLRLKSNYVRSYRRPNFSELFHPDFSYIRGNPELEPEESWDFDVGLELASEGWGPVGTSRVEAVFFHRNIEQSIEWVQFGTTFMPTNTGDARSRGYELTSSTTLLDRLDLSGSYTYLDTEIKNSGTDLPHTPRNQLFGRAALRIARSRLWIEYTFEDDHFLNETGLRRADEAKQIDAGISVLLADVPGLRWLPDNIWMSTEWINLTGETRVDSLGLPLPEDTLWYLRLRIGPRR